MVLSPTDSARIIALIQDGRSQRYVAQFLDVSRCSVQRAVKRFQQTGEYTRRRGSGRGKCTTARDDRFLALRVLRNRKTTAVNARNELQEVRGVAVSERTVRRRLVGHNLNARRPANGPQLTRQHRVGRLHFGREHQNWGIEEWGQILFTDESRFCLKSPDGRQRIWRRRGERFAQCNIVPKLNFGGGSIMVWGGISIEARTELVVVNGGAMTADRYIRDIIEPHVVPFAPLIGDDFMLMHDNARPHVARIVNEYLDEVELNRLVWPPKSPDLNPIEHVWDMVGRRVRSRIPAPANLRELSVAVVQECDEIDQNDIRHLIEGMPRRMEAVVRARGGNTRY
jgi:transposase